MNSFPASLKSDNDQQYICTISTTIVSVLSVCVITVSMSAVMIALVVVTTLLFFGGGFLGEFAFVIKSDYGLCFDKLLWMFVYS